MDLTGCPEVIKAHTLCKGCWEKHIFPKGIKKKTWHKRLLLFSIMNTTAMLEVSKDLEVNSFGIYCHKLPKPPAMETWSKLMKWDNRQIIIQQELPQNLYATQHKLVYRILKRNLPHQKELIVDHGYIHFCIWEMQVMTKQTGIGDKNPKNNKQPPLQKTKHKTKNKKTKKLYLYLYISLKSIVS